MMRTNNIRHHQVIIWFVLCISLYACQTDSPSATEINFPPTSTSTPQETRTAIPIQTVSPTETIIEDDCFDTAFTQLAMNFCAVHHAKRTREFLEEINSELKDTLTEKDWERLDENSQGWQRFKELDCTWIADHYWGGSIRPLIYGTCIASHNNLRIKLLSRFVCGHEPIPGICSDIQEYYGAESSLSISLEEFQEISCIIEFPADIELRDCLESHSFRLKELQATLYQTLQDNTREHAAYFTTPRTPKPGGEEGWPPEELVLLMGNRTESLAQIQDMYVTVRDEYCNWENSIHDSILTLDSSSYLYVCYSAYNIDRINSILSVCFECRELLEDIP